MLKGVAARRCWHGEREKAGGGRVTVVVLRELGGRLTVGLLRELDSKPELLPLAPLPLETLLLLMVGDDVEELDLLLQRELGAQTSLFGTDSWLDAELKLRGMPAVLPDLGTSFFGLPDFLGPYHS
ncbi:hypothetical protein B0H17DRAFT_1197499 [Mycena rosella]|uniref:Uncharacterized protein n=1 Tax=Mycena rosella TaxID=1033263 RepID=A0AAD7DTM8_MYCRO|nr:hypothetical protein B0H17DRAFT_1197499 [Mycena rosella]